MEKGSWKEGSGEEWKKEVRSHDFELAAVRASEEGRQAAEEERTRRAEIAFGLAQLALEEKKCLVSLGMMAWKNPPEQPPGVVVLLYVCHRSKRPYDKERRMRDDLLLAVTNEISNCYRSFGMTATFCLKTGCSSSYGLPQKHVKEMGRPFFSRLAQKPNYGRRG